MLYRLEILQVVQNETFGSDFQLVVAIMWDASQIIVVLPTHKSYIGYILALFNPLPALAQPITFLLRLAG